MIYPIVTVKVTYKGEPLTKSYYDSHEEIHSEYPSQDVFLNRLYLPLLETAKSTQIDQLLEISENVVQINGQKLIL